jgi:chaperonin GroEL (HSP60 family)
MAATNGPRVEEILHGDAERTRGDDALSMNIAAGTAVADTVQSTLGPNGRDKLIVGEEGDLVLTNDGMTVINELSLDHPAAGMVAGVAECMENQASDGTTSAVLLTGALLHEAEGLLDEGLHPTTVVDGYRTAVDRALTALGESAFEREDGTLNDVARTALNGVGETPARAHLSNLIVEAARLIADEQEVNPENVTYETVPGRDTNASKLIRGLVVDKQKPVFTGMPDSIEDASVAVVNTGIETPETKTPSKVRYETPKDAAAFREFEDEFVSEQVQTVVESGADVVFCLDGIDDRAQEALARHGVMAFRRVKHRDMEQLERTTGANSVTQVDDLAAADLGTAASARFRDLDEKRMLYLEDCAGADSVTLLLRGTTEEGLAERERAVADAVGLLRVVFDDERVVPGGGATEMMIALTLRAFSQGVDGREQLAVEAFADAIDEIPRTLAQNAGADPMDALLALRNQHADGHRRCGLVGNEATPGDAVDAGVVDAERVKRHVLESAFEATAVILRIDDIITASDVETDESPT